MDKTTACLENSSTGMEVIEKGYLHIGIKNNYMHNVENMKQYEITEKFMLPFKNWLEKIQGQVSKEGCTSQR